jgi:predicted Zn-dependent peptidase
MQLHYAIKQFLGQLAISNEAKLNEMIAMGRSALFYDEVETLEESVAIFEKITSEQILEVANEILDVEQFSTLIFRK